MDRTPAATSRPSGAATTFPLGVLKPATSDPKLSDPASKPSSPRTPTLQPGAVPLTAQPDTRKPTVKPGPKLLDTPASKIVDKPGPKLIDKPATKLIDKPATKLIDKPATKLIDKPATKLIDKPATKIVDKPGTKGLDKPATKVVDIPGIKIVDKPGAKIGRPPGIPGVPGKSVPPKLTGPITTPSGKTPSKMAGAGTLPGGISKPGGPHPDRTRFPERLDKGELDKLTKGQVAKQIKLSDQYKLSRQGDVARRLELQKNIVNVTNITNVTNVTNVVGAKPHPHPRPAYPIHGRVSPVYREACFHFHYFGPSYFAGACWYPRWSPWVDWSWHHHCHPVWDPRPVWCRPVIYVVATPWVWWEPPVWTPLPAVACGTWVEVQPVVVPVQQFDLQLLAVRFVDPGHPEEKMGPRYRVWFRNNSDQPVAQPFNVTLMASDANRLARDLPQAGVRVTAIESGDTQSVDVRLPATAVPAAPEEAERAAPAGFLHVLIDANREVRDVDWANNGVTVERTAVLPVDPAAFAAKPDQAPAGGDVVLAGEGLGPAPGKVLVHLGNLELEAEILGWYDLGARIKLPNLPLAGPTQAEVIVVRGDGAAANPLQVTVDPPQ